MLRTLSSPPRQGTELPRRSRFPWKAAVTVLLLAVCPCSLPLRAAGREPGTVRVSLGADTGLPGGPVMIPLSLETPDGIDAGRLAIAIEVPSNLLELINARISLATETADGKLQTDQTRSADGNQTTIIRLNLTAPKPLPSGTVASIQLRIASETGKASEIPLSIRSVEVTAVDGKKLEPVEPQDGHVTISTTPPAILNCFFFSH